MKTGVHISVLAAWVMFFVTGTALAESVVLDTTGFWRMYHTMKPPMIDSGRGLKPAQREVHLNMETATPPAKWADPDFDDNDWPRAPLLRAAKSPYLARLYLRGKFKVSNPAKVKGLKLNVGYHGGIIVYINGKEIKRKNLALMGRQKDPLADPYPEEAFVSEDGKRFTTLRRRDKLNEANQKRVETRERRLSDLEIPSNLLKKGVNVLAIEIIRAPYHNIHWTGLGRFRGDVPPYEIAWYTCEIRNIQLAARGAAGFTANFRRPSGLQVWNSQQLAGDFDLDFGDPNEPLQPIELTGAKNGFFSGKVVVGSTRSINGLEVTPTDLRRAGGKMLPASNMRIRYGMPWRTEQFFPAYLHQQPIPYPARPAQLAALFEDPPSEIPVYPLQKASKANQIPGALPPVPGAVVSIWVTVKVPSTAKPGTYKGKFNIKAGNENISVPVQLEVADWAIPDVDDWRTWPDFVQSPDTLAVEYETDLWSDEHFELIGKSFKLLGETGCRIVTVPVISRTHFGNEESMVRWIDKGNGSYDYDFSLMDRYLDTAEAGLGKPKVVVFYVWDVFLIPAEDVGKKRDYGVTDPYSRGRNTRSGRVAEHLKDAGLLAGGPPVSMLAGNDRAKAGRLPSLQAPESVAIWTHFFDALRVHMRERGMEDTMMLGITSDGTPTKEQFEFFDKVSGHLPWQSHSHTLWPKVGNQYKIFGKTLVGMQAMNHRFWPYDVAAENGYGWNQNAIVGNGPTGSSFDTYPASSWKHMMEYTMIGGFNCTRLKGDTWACFKNRSGTRRSSMEDRYPENSWRNLDILMSALAPGPDAAVATTRLEVFRAGMQESEARIFIEEALLDPESRVKMGEKLIGRCKTFLDERAYRLWKAVQYHQMDSGVNFQWYAGTPGHIWYMGSGWQDRTRELFSLAAEVERKL